MKKIVLIMFAMVFCFIFFGCNKNSNIEISPTSFEQVTSIGAKEVSSSVIADNTSILPAESDQGGGEILPRKYRNNYYQIPVFFAEIIDSDVFLAWEKEYYANNYADETNVMVMVAYIKEFNISKEDFERANFEYAKFIDEVYSHICLNPQDYADQEMQEIYNADIIYTFDNEIINKYYLGIDYPFLNEYQYEEAVAEGTYQTRTKEFVTLEEMEAEINAKYGAPDATEVTDVITETTAAIPEETKTTE